MRKPTLTFVAALAVVALAGCGSSGSEADEGKKTKTGDSPTSSTSKDADGNAAKSALGLTKCPSASAVSKALGSAVKLADSKTSPLKCTYDGGTFATTLEVAGAVTGATRKLYPKTAKDVPSWGSAGYYTEVVPSVRCDGEAELEKGGAVVLTAAGYDQPVCDILKRFGDAVVSGD